jgi:hypothetical protein
VEYEIVETKSPDKQDGVEESAEKYKGMKILELDMLETD